jgi:hypothetical protein
MLDDWLKFSCGVSFATFAFFSFAHKDGSSFAIFAADMVSLFGCLTLVLVLALAVRTALRWKRQKSD